MFKEIQRSVIAVATGVTAILAVATSSWAAPPCPLPTGEFDFDFAGTQYKDCFRDVVRGGAIKAGLDFGRTGHTSLNIGGGAAAAGRTWMTVVDQDPSTPAADLVYAGGTVCADVLIKPVRKQKGAGVVALYNQDPTKKGLALILSNAGDTDLLVLGTVAGDANGAFTQLTSVPLDALIAEKTWYRVVMTVTVGASPQILGQAYRHTVGTDPNSDIVAIGTQLSFAPAVLPVGVEQQGEEGIIGWAVGVVDNSSVTNFTNVRDFCLNTPPPCLDAETLCS